MHEAVSANGDRGKRNLLDRQGRRRDRRDHGIILRNTAEVTFVTFKRPLIDAKYYLPVDVGLDREIHGEKHADADNDEPKSSLAEALAVLENVGNAVRRRSLGVTLQRPLMTSMMMQYSEFFICMSYYLASSSKDFACSIFPCFGRVHFVRLSER